MQHAQHITRKPTTKHRDAAVDLLAGINPSKQVVLRQLQITKQPIASPNAKRIEREYIEPPGVPYALFEVGQDVLEGGFADLEDRVK